MSIHCSFALMCMFLAPLCFLKGYLISQATHPLALFTVLFIWHTLYIQEKLQKYMKHNIKQFPIPKPPPDIQNPYHGILFPFSL